MPLVASATTATLLSHQRPSEAGRAIGLSQAVLDLGGTEGAIRRCPLNPA
jgi:hypothetical protein